MKFLLTSLGEQKIKKIISSEKKFLLQIALSDQYDLTNSQPTELSHTILTIKPTVKKTTHENPARLHLQIQLDKNQEENNIHEIGLLIAEEKTTSFTLFAISSSDKVIFKRSSTSDLLIDFFINFDASYFQSINIDETNPPKPLIPYAKEDTYGIVRFATTEEINQRTPGLALSADHLDMLTNKIYLNGKISQPLSAYHFKLNAGFTEIALQAIVSKVKFIHQINLEKNKHSISYSLFKYNLQTEKLESCTLNSESTLGKFIPSSLNACLHYNHGGHLECVFLAKKSTVSAESYVSKLDLQVGKSAMLKTSQVTFNSNSCLLYNHYVLGTTITDQYSTELKLIHLEQSIKHNSTKNILLRNFLSVKRKKALTNMIHDKIYYIGGTMSGDNPLVEITALPLDYIHELEKRTSNDGSEIIGEKKIHSFTPRSAPPITSKQVESLISCVHGSSIYLFNPNDYYPSSEENPSQKIYRYHTLSHQWQTLTPDDKIMIAAEKNCSKHASVVSTPVGIYLFLTHGHPNKSGDFELNILKYAPPP